MTSLFQVVNVDKDLQARGGFLSAKRKRRGEIVMDLLIGVKIKTLL